MRNENRTTTTPMDKVEIEPNWNRLCVIGGVAALSLLVYSLVTIVLFLVIGGPPETAEETFTLLQENRILGLLRLDLLTMVCMPLYYLLFTGLYAAFRKTKPDMALLGLLVASAGVTLFLASPSVLSLVHLSDLHAVATTPEARAQYLAAGEAILAADMWHGTGAAIGGILNLGATLLFAGMMLKDSPFSKTTGYVGIATHGLDLLHILLGFAIPVAGVILMAIAGTLYVVWFPLLARGLLRFRDNLGQPGAVAGDPSP